MNSTMNSYRTRNSNVPTRSFTTPRSTLSTATSSSSTKSKAIPKKFTASSPRNSINNNNNEIKTFTNRCVNRKNYRVAAPPKFLQRSGGKAAQVKPEEQDAKKKTVSRTTTTTSSSLRRHSRPELKHTSLFHKEEDPAITASESDEQPEEREEEKKKKEKPKVRRHDPLVYRSKNCTFDQDYLSMLTFDPKLEDFTLSDEEEEEKKEPKVAPRAKTFKPYVRKEQSSGFGFWSSGLEDSLLSGSGFSYKPAVAKKKALPNRTIKTEGDKKKNVLPPTTATSSAFSSSPMFF